MSSPPAAPDTRRPDAGPPLRVIGPVSSPRVARLTRQFLALAEASGRSLAQRDTLADGDGASKHYLRRVLRNLTAAVDLLLSSPPDRGASAVLVVGDRFDRRLLLPVALAARVRRHRTLVLHAAAGEYLDRVGPVLRTLCALTGPADAHVLPCPEVASRFRWVYRTTRRCLSLPALPPVTSIPPTPGLDGLPSRPGSPAPRSHSDAPGTLTRPEDSPPSPAPGLGRGEQDKLRLGCLAASPTGGRAKTAADTLDELTRRGESCELVMGHPDDDPAAFVARIDVLLHPHHDPGDPRPRVVSEALLAGVPVIALGGPCIRSVIGKDGGHVVEQSDVFARKAMRLVAGYLHGQGGLPAAADAARRQGQAVATESRHQAQALLAIIAG